MRFRPPGSLEWDAGLASERTVFAWERTAVASIAVAVLVARAGVVYDALAIAAPAATLLAVAGLAEWRHSRRIYAEHDRPFREGAPLQGRAVAAVTAVTVISAVAATALTIAS